MKSMIEILESYFEDQLTKDQLLRIRGGDGTEPPPGGDPPGKG